MSIVKAYENLVLESKQLWQLERGRAGAIISISPYLFERYDNIYKLAEKLLTTTR